VYVSAENGVFALIPAVPGNSIVNGVSVPCAAGYSCVGGFLPAVLCLAGTYAPTASASCLACLDGEFAPSDGASKCTSGLDVRAPWPMRGFDTSHSSQSPYGRSTRAWTYATGGEVRSSPAIAVDGTVIVGSDDGYVYAFFGVTGALRWVFPTAGPVRSSAAIGAGGVVYIGSDDAHVYALVGSTGAPYLWKYRTGGAVSGSPALNANGTVYVGSEDGFLYVLDGIAGALLSKRALSGVVRGSSAAIDPIGLFYLGYSAVRPGDTNGIMVADVEQLSGLHLLGYKSVQVDLPVLSSPAVAPYGLLSTFPFIVIGSDDSNVYALVSRFRLEELWVFETGGPVRSSPAIHPDGTVFFGSGDSYVYAVDGETGDLRWSFKTGGAVDGSPAVLQDGSVVVGSADSFVYAFNASTGSLRWKVKTSGPVVGSLAVAADGTVYVGSGSYVYALVPVPPGYVIDAQGQSLCPGGYFCPGGYVPATACPPGTYSSAGAATCLACPAGTYNTLSAQAALAACLSCPAGSASFVTGASSSGTCIRCGPGSYALDGASVCTSCGPGTYFNGTGGTNSSACIPAPPGTMVQVSGAASYRACYPGTFAAESGSSVCEPCAPGHFAGAAGSTSCTPCAPGYASQAVGAAACSACGIGTYAAGHGSSQCSPCAAGLYFDGFGATSAANCTPCAAGTYNPAPGQGSSACIACPAGSASAAVGASFPGTCELCAAGTFSAGGAAGCRDCQAGTFAGGRGSAACEPCLLGTFARFARSTSCETCPSGTTTFASESVCFEECWGDGKRMGMGGQERQFCFPPHNVCAAYCRCPRAAGAYQCIAGAYACAPGLEPADPTVPPTGPGDCRNVTCVPPLVPTDGGCSSQCGPGLYPSAAGDGSCAVCPAGRTCIGVFSTSYFADAAGWTAALTSSRASRRLVAVPPNTSCVECSASMVVDLLAHVNNIGSAGALVYPVAAPTTSTVSLAWQVAVIVGLSMAFIASVVFAIAYWQCRCCSRAVDVASRMLKALDTYSTHQWGRRDQEAVTVLRTELGGACTITVLGVILALSASLIVNYAAHNAVTQSSVMPVGIYDGGDSFDAATYLPQSRQLPGWPLVTSFMLVVIAQGAAPGDCALPPGTRISGLSSGASFLSTATLPETDVSVLSCPGCLFGSDSGVSAQLKYSCQNVVLGAVAVNATGGAVLTAVNASARAGRRLTELSWNIGPLVEVSSAAIQPLYLTARASFPSYLQLRHDSTANAPAEFSRGFRVIADGAAPVFSNISTNIVPNAAGVVVTITLGASSFFVSTTVTYIQTPTQARCVHTRDFFSRRNPPSPPLRVPLQLLAGIFGFFGVASAFSLIFNVAELFLKNKRRAAESIRRGSQLGLASDGPISTSPRRSWSGCCVPSTARGAAEDRMLQPAISGVEHSPTDRAQLNHATRLSSSKLSPFQPYFKSARASIKAGPRTLCRLAGRLSVMKCN
jgi:outer membrane protein assembly factor BamB